MESCALLKELYEHGEARGADARPFVTHHNALGRDLYLRIATERIATELQRMVEFLRLDAAGSRKRNLQAIMNFWNRSPKSSDQSYAPGELSNDGTKEDKPQAYIWHRYELFPTIREPGVSKAICIVCILLLNAITMDILHFYFVTCILGVVGEVEASMWGAGGTNAEEICGEGGLGPEEEALAVKDRLPRGGNALVLEEELAPNEEGPVPLRCTPNFGGYMKPCALSPIALGKIVVRAIGLGNVVGGLLGFVAGGVSEFVGGGVSRFFGGVALSILTVPTSMYPSPQLPR